MDRYILIDGIAYDVNQDREAATKALIDAGLSEERVYVGDPEDPDSFATLSVLSDSGQIHQRGR